ncbi:MAG TPA: hypothetical protein PKA66_13720, partial [Gemmatimonadales bacterium]|nr:hypothetical protein [Gemmatimonadales bacterium]
MEALPLTAQDVSLLIEASAFDWSGVEPSIFGTLLVRALDPEERHRLGAEYTPRAYIERLVEPTVVGPIRERWTAVQAAVVQLEESGRKKDREAARRQLLEFHGWLRGLRFLDPACGSGNFLYVTMAAVKRVELEVLSELERVAGREQKEAVLDEVHPRQFHGIEVKPWAREIAELTLWIGYHQFWREAHGGRTPPDPILEDTGTIECRDAVLAWDAILHRPEKDRPDPTPRIPHPVTGELVPDPERTLPYYEYVGARQAEWPRADFIVGNPPYLGAHRMREALGDGYTESLRAVYPEVPAKADLVMYWWWRAANAISAGPCLRAGLITTNTITQVTLRPLIARARRSGARVVWAIPDHPWSSEDGAAVRVALTVLSRPGGGSAIWTRVDAEGNPTEVRPVLELHDDLSPFADVATAATHPLLASHGLAFAGYKLHGAGFILETNVAEALLVEPKYESVVHPYLNGRDFTQRPRGAFVIDFGVMSEAEAMDFPLALQKVADRVRPERANNKREVYRKYWWRFGEPRIELRQAIEGLKRYIITPETSKHRLFAFMESSTAPDNKLWVIAVEDPMVLGVLSSIHHATWAIAAGAKLEDRPVYVGSNCFDSYPLPPDSPTGSRLIGDLAEHLDQHRKDAIARDERVTMTGMYNVVEKLRSGEKLTPKERAIH